jgi:acetoin utilization deacetylase AcuC-like enzyme
LKALFDERQRKHDPNHFMANGVVLPSPEQPARVDALFNGASKAGCSFDLPEDRGRSPLAAVHTTEYLVFLETIHTRWSRIEGASNEVIPNVHPDSRRAGYPRSAIGQAGFHQTDTACPIAADTWESAYWAAQSALAGAELLLTGERAAYALCRPPGHHAFSDLAGGFCFINNAAVAAQHLREKGHRPAILDVDVHHGNGTQGIFYERSDVLTVSVHADPIRFYPFFWGHAEERGEGAGRGCNLNLPLPRGAGDTEFMAELEKAAVYIRGFGADALVVALGLDAYEKDPLKGLAVTTPGFGAIGEMIGKLGLPTLMVQEGGYLSPELGDNLASFLMGFESA